MPRSRLFQLFVVIRHMFCGILVHEQSRRIMYGAWLPPEGAVCAFISLNELS